MKDESCGLISIHPANAAVIAIGHLKLRWGFRVSRIAFTEHNPAHPPVRFRGVWLLCIGLNEDQITRLAEMPVVLVLAWLPRGNGTAISRKKPTPADRKQISFGDC